MRVLMKVTLPNDSFNAAVRAGTTDDKLKRILEETRPEAAYFIEMGGKRTGILVVDLPDPSRIPALAEPWFLTFNADVSMHPAMTREDVERAGIDALGKKWA